MASNRMAYAVGKVQGSLCHGAGMGLQLLQGYNLKWLHSFDCNLEIN